jgi:hypothetical protein
MHSVLRASARASLVIAIMFLGSLVLWIGIPLLWLWVGSLVQGATESLAGGLFAAMIGSMLSIVAFAAGLSRLNRLYQRIQRSRGIVPGNPLEVVLVVTAMIAIGGFSFWFLILAGPGPLIAPR